MKILSKGEGMPFDSAIALGMFDGVHLGHSAVIDNVVKSKEEGLAPIVFTFSVGSMVQKHDRELFYIFSNKIKLELFNQLGIEYVCSPRFGEMKNMSAEDFAREILKNRLRAKKVACGHNFHFGKGGVYGLEELCFLGKKYGFEVESIPRVTYEEKPISSVLIREYIKIGEIEIANRLLGRNYFIEQIVSHGNKIGRTIDFSTLNQYFDERQLIPHFGAYASITIIDNQKYASITNIGVKPTVQRRAEPLAETHIFGYNGDIYGQIVRVELLHFIRGEQRFNSINELKNRIAIDAKAAKEYLRDNGWEDLFKYE